VFPGNEANYLRAQIARISASTVLCPAGLFEVNEDGGLDKAEEWSPLPDREMGAAANWAHRWVGSLAVLCVVWIKSAAAVFLCQLGGATCLPHAVKLTKPPHPPSHPCCRYPHLKAQGRCTLHKREPPEGEEDTFEWTEEELEEGPELLTAAEEDAEVLGGAAWTPLFSSVAEHVKYQVAGLRSNQWPGAFCACLGERFTNVYVGWGVKNATFVPLPPPPVSF